MGLNFAGSFLTLSKPFRDQSLLSAISLILLKSDILTSSCGQRILVVDDDAFSSKVIERIVHDFMSVRYCCLDV